MFNKVHQIGSGTNSEEFLVFAGSKYVKAFPCGRRRAYETDNTPVPFDPEAKLNTELNNRKIVGTSGFANSFYNGQEWSTSTLKLVIGGYSFELDLNSDNSALNDFCNNIAKKIYFAEHNAEATVTQLKDFIKNYNNLFVNIKLAKVKLYESAEDGLDSYTWMLKNQSNDDNISWLDLPETANGSTEVDNFYFSGLSFSLSPVVDTQIDSNETLYHAYDSDSTQQNFSFKLFIYSNNSWKLNPFALLPKITHGDSVDSVQITELQTGSAYISEKVAGTLVKTSIPSLKVSYQSTTTDGDVYRLQFGNTDVSHSNS